MSQETKKHSFLAEEGSPLEAVMNYIKSSPGKTLKGEIEDWAAMMHYPYALHQSGESFEVVAVQALESIRRLNQEIQTMTTLLNSLAIAQGKPLVVPPHLSSMGATLPPALPESVEAPQPKAEPEPEPKTEPKRLSKYVVDPF